MPDRQPIRMPQFGEAAADATVVAWLVQPGAEVKAEQELVEVQTEKSLLTVAAPADGVLVEHAAKPGDTVAVGEVLGYVKRADGAAVPTVTSPTPPALPAITPSATPSAATSSIPSDVHVIGTAPKAVGLPPRVKRNGPRLADRAALMGAGEAAFLSPRVRAKVAEAGLKPSDLSVIHGTGEGGRITAEDIDRYLAQGHSMSPVRQAVANSMTRSWARPLATVARQARLDALLAHRRSVAGRPSLTVYALRAFALGLVQHRTLMSRLYGSRLINAESVDLAVAVEIEDGVLTPVIRGIERIPLQALTVTVDQVIDKARVGRVADAGDAVASISNYGVFKLTWATPIPLPGHSCILGLGDVQNVPDWNPATKTWDRIRACEVTLTFDHRIADGGAAGRLLAAVVEGLEHPDRL